MHYPRLVRALVLAGSSGAAAEDIAQEAFARTFRHWRRVRRGTNPPGYLYRVAFRLLRRRGLLPTTALDEAALPVSGPEDAAVFHADLERLLRAMPPRRRACAILCLALGLTPTDAAEALRIAPGTVRKQLELARATLRSGLVEQAGPLERPTAGGS
ncbi:MAG TPA: sigma-70 family RNA polymerase sigma factor [Acidimicrobiales bacterium]|nr:sigma-70 family RNA polymerase sigma factor [Acidimicrobiales bacterium]